MQETNIGWTDFSSSPVKYRDKNTRKVVWACVKASPGCVNCYAESLAMRWNKGKPFTATNMPNVEPFLDTAELKTLLTSKKIAGKRVFIEDMSDLFGAWVPDEMIDQVFAVMALRSDVTFQVLTKRADRMAAYLDRDWMSNGGWHRAMVVGARCCDLKGESAANWGEYVHVSRNWPLTNVLVGFSAENQEWFNKRSVEAAPLMRAGWNVWTSFEPMLGPIIVQGDNPAVTYNWLDKSLGLKWAVVGGESGRGHRTCEVDAITDLAAQFKAAGVPLFVKQDSGMYPGKQGRIPLDVWEIKEHPAAKAGAA